jgi:hypothetical protein
MAICQENAGVDFEKDYFEVLEQASKQKKPIFMEFGVNCGYCYKMKKEVFIDPEVGRFYNSNFINLIIDERSDIGRDLAERFNVYSYPTYFYLSPGGDITHIAANYKSPEKIIKEAKKALDDKVHRPSGVWWNNLKTRSKSTYDLFNSANSAFTDLTGYSQEFSNSQLSLSRFEPIDASLLSSAKNKIEQSLDIEEYYFNTFVAAIIYHLSDEPIKAKNYAQIALSDFPHHKQSSRTRDEILRQVIEYSKSE